MKAIQYQSVLTFILLLCTNASVFADKHSMVRRGGVGVGVGAGEQGSTSNISGNNSSQDSKEQRTIQSYNHEIDGGTHTKRIRTSSTITSNTHLRRQLQQDPQTQGMEQQPQNQQQSPQNDPQPLPQQDPGQQPVSQQNQQAQQPMTPEQPPQQQQQQGEAQGEATSSSVPLPILFLAAVFALYMIRKRLMDHNNTSTYAYRGLSRNNNASSSNSNISHLGGSSFWNSKTSSIPNDEYDVDGDDDYDDENFTYGASVNTNRIMNHKKNGMRNQTMSGTQEM